MWTRTASSTPTIVLPAGSTFSNTPAVGRCDSGRPGRSQTESARRDFGDLATVWLCRRLSFEIVAHVPAGRRKFVAQFFRPEQKSRIHRLHIRVVIHHGDNRDD